MAGSLVLPSRIASADAVASGATIRTAPILGAATNFRAGAPRGKLERLQRLGFDALRDGIRWKDVEVARGRYDFGRGSGARIAALARAGLLGSVTLHPQHPLYDHGQTVTSEAGIAAFAAFAAAVADHLPMLDLEIGNEFNGRSFVSGPARAMTAIERAVLHARMLDAIAATGQVPASRIIGGAAHSLPGAYFEAMLARGAKEHMAALAVHPYSSAPEALPVQLDIIRRRLDTDPLAIEITEFGHAGSRDVSRAPDAFWKGFCAAAEARIRRFVWYPLETRRDGYAALFDAREALTPLGRAFLLAKHTLEGTAVHLPWAEISGIRACQFDDRALVIWGAPRAVVARRTDLAFHHADLRPLEGAPTLSRDRVLLVLVPDRAPPFEAERDLRLGGSSLLADSADDWSHPERATSVLQRRLEKNGEILPFQLCPGQGRGGVPWVPYLCSDTIARAVLTDRTFVLGPATLLHRFEAPRPMRLVARLEIELSKTSRDGVVAGLRHNGVERHSRTITDRAHFDFAAIEMARGDTVTVSLSPGGTPRGDAGGFRVSFHDADAPAFQPVFREAQP